MLARTSHDPGWQAPLCAAAAAIPGLLLVLLGIAAIVSGADAACRAMLAGQVLFGAIVIVTTLAFVRAAVLAIRRYREAEQLVKASVPATGELACIAARTGIPARVIAGDQPFCVLARMWNPVAIISAGGVTRLNDRELEAAMHHERGHARRGDQLISAALSFLVDLLPLPAMDLVSMYRRARELAADRHALETVEAPDLAGALLSFVHSGRGLRGVAALSGDSTVRIRLDMLLRDSAPPPASPFQRVLLTVALAVVFAAGLAPARATLLNPSPCDMPVIRPHATAPR
ncbi:MAG: M56 family metallopeptidase [Candidatus Velthaea sp.]